LLLLIIFLFGLVVLKTTQYSRKIDYRFRKIYNKSMSEQIPRQEKSPQDITADTQRYIKQQRDMIRIHAAGATIMGLVLAGKLYFMGVDGASVAEAIKFSVFPVIFMALNAGQVWLKTELISRAIDNQDKAKKNK
jgi:hypothetical protein